MKVWQVSLNCINKDNTWITDLRDFSMVHSCPWRPLTKRRLVMVLSLPRFLHRNGMRPQRRWRLGGGPGAVDTSEHGDGGSPPHSPTRHHRTSDNLKKLFHRTESSDTFPNGFSSKNRFVQKRAPTCEAAATRLRCRCTNNVPLNNHSYMTWSPTLPTAQIPSSAQSMQHSFMIAGDTSRQQDFIVWRWCRAQ